MRRRSSPFDEWLSFGGRVPPAVGGLIVAIVGFTILGALVGTVASLAAFAPSAVAHGEVWRLVTWPFVGGRDVLTLLLGALTLYWVGRDLTWAWGPRRFLVTFFALAALSAAGTTLLAQFLRPLDGVWLGPWPVLSALIVAWAMLFPERQILFMFALPISGRALGWITVGGTLLSAVFERGGAWVYVPHLLAQGIMALYLRGFSARGLWQTFKIRSLERRARRRASHLKVVHKNGGDGTPPRWMN